MLSFLQRSLLIWILKSHLESSMNDLRAIKQLILHRIHEIGKDNFDLLERILYSIIIRAEEKSKSIYDLADMLNDFLLIKYQTKYLSYIITI